MGGPFHRFSREFTRVLRPSRLWCSEHGSQTCKTNLCLCMFLLCFAVCSLFYLKCMYVSVCFCYVWQFALYFMFYVLFYVMFLFCLAVCSLFYVLWRCVFCYVSVMLVSLLSIFVLCFMVCSMLCFCYVLQLLSTLCFWSLCMFCFQYVSQFALYLMFYVLFYVLPLLCFCLNYELCCVLVLCFCYVSDLCFSVFCYVSD